MKITIKLATGTMKAELPGCDKLENARKSKCNGCGKDIFFAWTEKGNWMPFSELGDGTLVSHFFDCPKAKTFRKPKK